MDITEFFPVGLFFLLLAAIAPPLGWYIGRLLGTSRTDEPVHIPRFEATFYRVLGIDGIREMDWKDYLKAILIFNLVGLLVLMTILLTQHLLPFNPDGTGPVGLALAFNTAVSFVTNTNWQSYAGETTLSYFSQMIGLGVQNFVSAATGIAVLAAVIRGFSRSSGSTLGNAWRDLTRMTVGLLLPLSLVFAVFLTSQGVVQTFSGAETVQTLEGQDQVISRGPAASQISIKQLGTNGGGFFNANSAHPFENPTPLTNALHTLALVLIPAALCFTYGFMTGRQRHGMALFATMSILLVVGLTISIWAELNGAAHLEQTSLMEGKEVRFGVVESVLYSTTTTAASNGSVNSMHSSLTPAAGGVAMLNMMLGEIIFGGVGSGLYGMILFVILTVFLTGLMVGRTPEYMGKRIDAIDVRWAMVAIIVPSASLLSGAALALMTEAGRASLMHAGVHGFSEVLYAMASAAGNNGSAFAGLNANTDFYNTLLGIIMLIGRYGVIIPVVVIAGRMVNRIRVADHAGSFPTHSPLFIALLCGTILIVGALTFFPALLLGPLAEQVFLMTGGF